jgi:hypothetical protein
VQAPIALECARSRVVPWPTAQAALLPIAATAAQVLAKLNTTSQSPPCARQLASARALAAAALSKP